MTPITQARVLLLKRLKLMARMAPTLLSYPREIHSKNQYEEYGDIFSINQMFDEVVISLIHPEACVRHAAVRVLNNVGPQLSDKLAKKDEDAEACAVAI